MSKIELLFDLIPDYPGLYLCVIEDENYNCVQSLADFSKRVEAHLHVKNLSDKTYEKSLHVEDFSYGQKSYNSHAVQYDFVFLCSDISQREDIQEITKKIYRILKNAAHVFILSPKETTATISPILEESNFVALNVIELTDDIDVISAKKMHGWMRV